VDLLKEGRVIKMNQKFLFKGKRKKKFAPTPKMNAGACYELIGTVIREAVDDYRLLHTSINKVEHQWKKVYSIKPSKRTPKETAEASVLANRIKDYYSAKRFLFGDGLDSWVNSCLPELDLQSIRELANTRIPKKCAT